MSQLKVDTIRHTSASSDAITLASDGTATAKITNVAPGNRNLIINGAMQVAQRGTSSTTNGYGTVDRFQQGYGGHDEVLTQAQIDLTSSDTGPWAKGFRKAMQITNGDQTGGAGAVDYGYIGYVVEAQDLANSGWDYTSASSYITLSFWIKSSVAGNNWVHLYNFDGTAQGYSFLSGNLSANTWTKVTHSIPGNSNLQLDNNNSHGFWIQWSAYLGTDYTTSGHTVNQWANYNSASRQPDMAAATWWTTDEATYALTGVQLEVGDVATDYNFKRYGEELLDCQRYYEEISQHDSGGMAVAIGQGYNTRKGFGMINFKVTKRVAPTAADVSIGIDEGDTNHTCSFYTTTSGTTIKSQSSTDIGNADITTGEWTGKFSAEL